MRANVSLRRAAASSSLNLLNDTLVSKERPRKASRAASDAVTPINTHRPIIISPTPSEQRDLFSLARESTLDVEFAARLQSSPRFPDPTEAPRSSVFISPPRTKPREEEKQDSWKPFGAAPLRAGRAARLPDGRPRYENWVRLRLSLSRVLYTRSSYSRTHVRSASPTLPFTLPLTVYSWKRCWSRCINPNNATKGK